MGPEWNDCENRTIYLRYYITFAGDYLIYNFCQIFALSLFTKPTISTEKEQQNSTKSVKKLISQILDLLV